MRLLQIAVAFSLLGLPLLAEPTPQTQVFQTSAGPVKITPMIHASTLIQAGDKIIYVDPARLPSTAGLAPADFILISDIHGDHMDPAALAALSKDSTVIYVPPAVQTTVTKAVAISNGETRKWDKVMLAANIR